MLSFRIVPLLARTAAVLGMTLPVALALGLLGNTPYLVFTAAHAEATSSMVPSASFEVLSLLLAELLGGALAYMTVRRLQGRRVGPLACARAALGRIHVVVSAGLVTSVALLWMRILLTIPSHWLFQLLFVLPSMFLMTAFFVAVPVATLEDLDLRASLRRSAYLTQGYRFHILSLIGILVLVMLFVGGLSAKATTQWDNPWIGSGLLMGVQVLMSVVSGILTAVVYIDLRRRVGQPLAATQLY